MAKQHVTRKLGGSLGLGEIRIVKADGTSEVRKGTQSDARKIANLSAVLDFRLVVWNGTSAVALWQTKDAAGEARAREALSQLGMDVAEEQDSE